MRTSDGRTALMGAAAKCHIKCCRLILNKIANNKKFLRKVILIKYKSEATALTVAINSKVDELKRKIQKKCAKLILRMYDVKDDAEDIFLSCLQLSDITTAQKIWNNTNGDRKLQELKIQLK